jgi:probable rRNA maturation factor
MASALTIDIIIESADWAELPDAARLVRKVAQAAAATLSTKRAELAIVLTDDSAIRALNRDWRSMDRPTNVLSFPAPQQFPPLRRSGGAAGDAADGTLRHLGDIVIAYATTAREARAEGKSLADHLAHLVVHGFLHLLGHDHDDDSNAEAMESLERAILARLGIADPYALRDIAPTTGRHA